MKFTFDKDAMVKEIGIAQEIISTKNAGSILSTVLLKAQDNCLVIKATDIKVNFETKIPVQVMEEGSTTVYCATFMGILANLDEGEIEFSQNFSSDGNQAGVEIKPVIGKSKYQLKSMSQENFPEFDTSDDLPYFEVSSKDLKEMISQTSFAVSVEETRYFMNGVYFEKKGDSLNLVGTDSRRLSFASKSLLAGVTDFPPAIVHPKILGIISKHAPEEGNISIAVVDKMIFFKFGSYKFGAVLLEGRFPDYTRVIPEKQQYSFQVDKNDLVKAMKRISLLVEKDSGRIYFTISDGVLKLSSQNKNLGYAEEEIPCEYAGQKYVIALNYRYVEEPLKVISTERIAFEFTEEMKAVTMKPEPQADYFHIIMPMQKE